MNETRGGAAALQKHHSWKWPVLAPIQIAQAQLVEDQNIDSGLYLILSID